MLSTGACAKDGQVKVGDRLLSVNGRSLWGLSLSECCDALKPGAATIVSVLILRHSPGNAVESSNARIPKLSLRGADREHTEESEVTDSSAVDDDAEKVGRRLKVDGQSGHGVISDTDSPLCNINLDAASESGHPQLGHNQLFAQKPFRLAFGRGSFRDEKRRPIPKTQTQEASVRLETETSESEPEKIILTSKHSGPIEDHKPANTGANQIVLIAQVHNSGDDSSASLSDTSTIVMDVEDDFDRPPQLPRTLPPELTSTQSPAMEKSALVSQPKVISGSEPRITIPASFQAQDSLSDDIPVTNIDDLLDLDSESSESVECVSLVETSYKLRGADTGHQDRINSLSRKEEVTVSSVPNANYQGAAKPADLVLKRQDSPGSEVKPLGQSPLTPMDFHFALVNPFEELEREYSEDSAMESQLSYSSTDQENTFFQKSQDQGNALGGVGINFEDDDDDDKRHGTTSDILPVGETLKTPDVIPPSSSQLSAASWGTATKVTPSSTQQSMMGIGNQQGAIPKVTRLQSPQTFKVKTSSGQAFKPTDTSGHVAVTKTNPDVLQGHVTVPTPPNFPDLSHTRRTTILPSTPPPLPPCPPPEEDTHSKYSLGSAATKSYNSLGVTTFNPHKTPSFPSKLSNSPKAVSPTRPTLATAAKLPIKTSTGYPDKVSTKLTLSKDLSDTVHANNSLLPQQGAPALPSLPPPPSPPPLPPSSPPPSSEAEDEGVQNATLQKPKDPDMKTDLKKQYVQSLLPTPSVNYAKQPETVTKNVDALCLDQKEHRSFQSTSSAPTVLETNQTRLITKPDTEHAEYHAEERGFDIMSLALPLSPEPVRKNFADSSNDPQSKEINRSRGLSAKASSAKSPYVTESERGKISVAYTCSSPPVATNSTETNMSNHSETIYSQPQSIQTYHSNHNLSTTGRILKGGDKNVSAYLGHGGAIKNRDDILDSTYRDHQSSLQLNNKNSLVSSLTVPRGAYLSSLAQPGHEQADKSGLLGGKSQPLEDVVPACTPTRAVSSQQPALHNGQPLESGLIAGDACTSAEYTRDYVLGLSDNNHYVSSSLSMESKDAESVGSTERTPTLPKSPLRKGPAPWKPLPLAPRSLSASSLTTSSQKPTQLKSLSLGVTSSSSPLRPVKTPSPTESNASMTSMQRKERRTEREPFTVEVPKGLLGIGLDVKVIGDEVKVSRIQSMGPVARDGNIK